MRVLSIGIALLAVVAVMATWLQYREPDSGLALLPGSEQIHITGTGNTLSSVARQAGDPKLFSYDPATRRALSHATLIIEGELQLGRPGEAASAEILEMATQTCGDLRIEVRPSGALRLDHSTIRTESQVLSNTACSQGYSLFVDGLLAMEHGRISYLSGSTSQCLRRSARAIIRNSTFSQCDGSALSCINVDGSRMVIDNSVISCAGNFAIIVQGCGGAPLEAHNCVFESQLGDVLVTGESADVRLVDCVFDPAKIVFNHDSGQLAVAWSRQFRVVDATGKEPRPGLLVRARPLNESDDVPSVEQRTDADGRASLVLTERILRPGASGQSATSMMSYEISVIGSGGEVLATRSPIAVRATDARLISIQAR